MTDPGMAKNNPASIFKRPMDVLNDNTLSRDDKIASLKQWALDERLMSVAEEENMQSGDTDKNNVLDEILSSLQKLGVDTDIPRPGPNKLSG